MYNLSESQGQQHYHKVRSQKASSVIQLYHPLSQSSSIEGSQAASCSLQSMGSQIRSLSDMNSGLLKFQEQVGREFSLPTQVSPLYSHQSQGTAERFHMTLYGKVRSIIIGHPDHLETRSIVLFDLG